MKKTIEVVAAVIEKDNTYLATQRGYGEFIHQWEFPGGKIEEGETREEALVREIQEELSLDIAIDDFLTTVHYEYEQFNLIMHCYLCHIVKGDMSLSAHEQIKWLEKENLRTVNWLPADVPVVVAIEKL